MISAELKLTIETVGQQETFDSVRGDVTPSLRVYCRNPLSSSHASPYTTDSIRDVLSKLPFSISRLTQLNASLLISVI